MLKGEKKRLKKEERRKRLEEERLEDLSSKKKNKLKNYFIYIILIILVIAVFIYLYNKPGRYDDFAKCLSEKGLKMYGSYQCSACAKQKTLFGKSFEFIDYVECGPLSGPVNQICIDNNINAYPIWIDNNGDQYRGVQSLKDLEEIGGCRL